MGKNLLIKGADFSLNALPYQLIIKKTIVVGGLNSKAVLRGPNETSRCTFVSSYPTGGNTLWGTAAFDDYADKGNYALNKIPFGATSIKVTCANIVISVCIFDANYNGLIRPSWSDSTGVQTIDLSSIQNGRYFSVNIQSENAAIDNVNVEFTF